MKKILLATSMLAATTGFAAAEGVTVSGEARMGVIYDRVGVVLDNPLTPAVNEANPGSMETLFTSRVRVKFAMVGTTDGGVEFGAAVRNDQSGQGNTANGDSTVYVSMNGLKLTMGDVGGAADALVGQVSGVGLTGLGDNNELGFVGTTKTAAYAEYSAGALTFGLGLGQLNGTGEMSVAVKYAADAFAVALGYEDNGAAGAAGRDIISLLGSATFGSATVKAKIADDSRDADMSYALSVDFAAGAGTYTAFYKDDNGVDAFGLGASYDLGGGAKIVGGVVDNNVDTIADLGISMSF